MHVCLCTHGQEYAHMPTPAVSHTKWYVKNILVTVAAQRPMDCVLLSCLYVGSFLEVWYFRAQFWFPFWFPPNGTWQLTKMLTSFT